MIDRNIILYVEEEDGSIEAMMITRDKYEEMARKEWIKQFEQCMQTTDVDSALLLEKIDFLSYVPDIYEEPVSRLMVPRKQLAAYSHKPKGVKRQFKTQNR